MQQNPQKLPICLQPQAWDRGRGCQVQQSQGPSCAQVVGGGGEGEEWGGGGEDRRDPVARAD